MAQTVLANLLVKIAANTAQFGPALAQAQKQFTGFTNTIKTVASSLGIALGVQQIASFVSEISKLAGEAKGVSDAFAKLENSERLLIRLKEATGDTVSELDLMKRAVQASNFGIELEALPKLLEFAAIRAQQTGQSVDYLVDSIITGIGRKSPLILDNLGISAVRLKEQFNGASLEAQNIGDVAVAVGRIASEELKKMGSFSENASSKFQRLTAETTNLKVAIGTVSNNTNILGDALDDVILIIQNLTTLLKSDAISALESYLKLASIVPRTTLKIINSGLELINEINSLENAVKNFNESFSDTPFAGVISGTKEYNEALSDLEHKAELAGKKVAILTDDLGKTVAVIKPFAQTISSINGIDEKVIVSIDTLNAKLKDLTDQFRSTDITDRGRLKTIAASIIATRQQIEELEKLLKVEKNRATGIDGLRAKLAELNKEFDQTDIHDKARLNAISQEIQSISALIDSLEKLRKKRNEANTLAQPKASTNKLTDQVLNPKVTLPGGIDSTLKFDPLRNFFENNQKAIQKLRDSLNGLKEQLIEIDLGGLIGNAVSDMAFALGQAAAGVGSFGDAILKSVIGFAKQLGEILISAGFAMLAVRKLITKPGLAIAAGVALLAIAGAASAALSRSQQSFNSGGGSSGSGGAKLTEIQYINRDNRLYVEGELKISGKTAKALITNQTRDDSRIKPRGSG